MAIANRINLLRVFVYNIYECVRACLYIDLDKV